MSDKKSAEAAPSGERRSSEASKTRWSRAKKRDEISPQGNIEPFTPRAAASHATSVGSRRPAHLA